MKKGRKFYIKLFWSTLCLSAFTFGGGFVIATLMKKKFVEELNWIEENEMLDFIAIAQSSPGAIAVNASILIGYKLAGLLGAIVTILATALPPFLIVSVISSFYTVLKNNEIANYILLGMQAGIAAVILEVVISMGMQIFKEKNLMFIFLMFAAFVLTFVFETNVMLIIFICGLIGISVTYLNDKSGKAQNKL